MNFSHTNVLVAAVTVLTLLLIEVDCKSARNYNKKRTYQEKESDVDLQAENDLAMRSIWDWLLVDSSSNTDTSADTDTTADGGDGSENSVVISNTGPDTDTDTGNSSSNQPAVPSASNKPKPSKPMASLQRGMLNAKMNILRRALYRGT